MGKIRKNLFLGIIVILSALVGYYVQEQEEDCYVMEMQTDAFESPIPMIALDEEETSKSVSESKVNINTASKESLKTLDGIGDAKAERIIKYREKHGNFEVIEDIMKVTGIGKKTFENFKDNICV